MTEKTLFYERIMLEIKLRAKSVNQVERELGYPRNALHNYRNVRKPSVGRVVELARYFGVSPEYLLGAEKEMTFPPPNILFKKLTKKQKIEMLLICQSWERKQFKQLLE